MTKKRGSKFGSAVAPSYATEKNRNMGAQVYSPTRTTALKVLLKIYFLYDYRCAQTCSFRAISGLPMRTLTIAARKQFTLLIDQKLEIFTFLGRVPTRVHRLP